MKPLSERDRAILARHEAGASCGEIAAEFGLSKDQVRVVTEHTGKIHARGRELLNADPESLEGLRLTGALSQRAYSAVANATYHFDVPDLERVSDVAAQGRECVARFDGVGAGVLAELDALLVRFSLAWNPRPRPFAYRTDENKHPLMKLWDKDREQSEQQAREDQYWRSIVRHVAEIERAVGTAVFGDALGRDSMEGVSLRLAFLTGYLGERAKRERETIDITPDGQDDSDYETAGNLICLPGVKLADVLDNGDRPDL